MADMQHPQVDVFFDDDSNTFSYIVRDPASKSCAIVDPVLDFDYASGCTGTKSADEMIAFIKQHDLELELIIETHVHADHLSSAPYLKQQLGGEMLIGEHIRTVQDTFGKVFNEGTEFARDGSQFDRLVKDGDTLAIGQLKGQAMYTPGHTPACVTFVFGDAAFVGDTLFMPDAGTARTDFPGGSASDLFDSITRILALPEQTRLFMCHDYGAPGRKEVAYLTSVAEERAKNIHVADGTSREQYIAVREARDKTLGMPRLIVPSLQVNMRAGDMPPPEDNGIAYLKVPLNVLGK